MFDQKFLHFDTIFFRLFDYSFYVAFIIFENIHLLFYFPISALLPRFSLSYFLFTLKPFASPPALGYYHPFRFLCHAALMRSISEKQTLPIDLSPRQLFPPINLLKDYHQRSINHYWTLVRVPCPALDVSALTNMEGTMDSISRLVNQ